MNVTNPQSFWNQDWFLNMPSKYKLFWFYISAKCTDTLHWTPNKLLFEKIIGDKIDFNEFLSLVNSDNKTRIEVEVSGRWFIKEIQTRQS